MVTQYLEPTSNLSRGTNRYASSTCDAEHGRCSGGMRVGGCWHSINSSTSGRDPAPPGGTSIGLVDRDIAPCIDSPISPTSVRPDRTSDCGPRNSSKSFELGFSISCRPRATHPLRIRRGGTHRPVEGSEHIPPLLRGSSHPRTLFITQW